MRRDSCRLVSRVIQKCLDLLLIDRNVEKAIDYVKSVVSDLLTNQIDMSLLVITKSLGRTGTSCKRVTLFNNVSYSRLLFQNTL